MTDEAKVDNIIMYMPVDVDTAGGTPKAIMRGLNILPPPKPRAPLINPPQKAKNSK